MNDGKIYFAIFHIFVLSNAAVNGKTTQQGMSTCPSLVDSFTWSSPRQYSLMNEKNYHTHSNPSDCSGEPDIFTLIVRQVLLQTSSSNTSYQMQSSILQELMVRGFQLLCSWTEPLREKFKLADKLDSSSRPRPLTIPKVMATSASQNYVQVHLSNVTINGFPAHHEKSVANPTNPRCSTDYKTYYEADSELMTICGNATINGTSTNFIITYRNVSVKINEIKIRTQNGHIHTKRIKEEFHFNNCTAQSTHVYLDNASILEDITPTLITEIFNTDPTGRLTYASISQDCKITEIYKKSVLKSMANLLMGYLSHVYATPYQISSSYSAPLPVEINRVQIRGLNLIQVCGSNMQIARRENNLSMKLTFTLKFPHQNNNTALILQQHGVDQARSIFIKQINVRLDFSSPIEESRNFGFHLVNVQAEISDKYSTPWYRKFAPKLNAVFGELIKEMVLAWILYEDN